VGTLSGVFLRLWNSKPVVLVRAAIEIYGIIKTLGAVSVSAVLGALAPAIVELGLNLSTFQKWVIGIGVFFVALALILAGVKAFLERPPQSKAATQGSVAERDSTPQSSDFQLWQELKRVEGEKEELRAALEQLEQEAEQMREWIDTLTPFMKRMQLRFILQAIHRWGTNLHTAQQPDVAAMEKWVSLTSALIRRYLDDETANFFLIHDGDKSFAGRLQRLEEIFDKPVDSGGKLQSDFDPAEAIEPYPSEWNYPSR